MGVMSSHAVGDNARVAKCATELDDLDGFPLLP
jgi:hypothetical protein